MLPMNLPDKVRRKLASLPDKPGCYMMRDGKGRIIYVGKAVSLRKRVQSYFREAQRRKADPKTRSLVNSVRDIDFLVVHNEAAAVLTEGKLIKEYKPRYNISFKDDKRFLLLKTHANQPYPNFKLARIRQNDGAHYFGPYASSRSARVALDFIEKRFGIRKCTPRIPNADTYKHCINDIVRYCSAPCIQTTTEAIYRENYDEACAFLGGHRHAYLKELRDQMKVLSEKRQFERAADLRDAIFSLERAIKQHARMAPTRQMRHDQAMTGISELATLLGLNAPPHVIEAYDISNISGTYAVASMVCAVDGLPRNNRYRRFRIRTVEGADDPRMMAEVISRRFGKSLRTTSPLPDLVIVDGGITQLRAARNELEALQLSHIPVAGLAKRYEEIYWHDEATPIRLPSDSAARKVLQRIRDEAHRFAITYHRHLRSSRIKDSFLDEIPGIGPKRKQLLLNHFGSVRRIRNATESDIASLCGIGPELAQQIHDACHPDAEH